MNKIQKESFKYSYTRPCLDWFDWVHVEIKPEDYLYFKNQRRFGPSWYLFGSNPKDEPKYHWETKEIGRVDDGDLIRFIEWAKNDQGSSITEITSIAGSFDIINEITNLLRNEVEADTGLGGTHETSR